jgi:RND family efflux transporter MFP subunit
VSRTGALVIVAFAVACHGGSGELGKAGRDAGGGDGGAATPVEAATVQRATLLEIVSAPGHTASIEQQQVRAPFAGKIVDLIVADGDRVKTGQVLGSMMAQTSVAALEGARVMAKAAHTPRQRRDARRALGLARRGLVKHTLRAPEPGVVVSHSADEGALVTADQVIVTIAALDSFVFVAEVVQNDLRRVRPGQPASIDLAAQRPPFDAVVHALLPTASSQTLTAPVRLDFRDEKSVPTAVNLFGTARIVVGQARDVIVVPAQAVLRDDVTGVERVATIGSENRLHWVRVTTGLTQRGLVQITSRQLPAGAPVIVTGQVGLTDGTRVRVESR